MIHQLEMAGVWWQIQKFNIFFSCIFIKSHTNVRSVTITDQYSWPFKVNVSYKALHKVVTEGFYFHPAIFGRSMSFQDILSQLVPSRSPTLFEV